MKRRHYEKFRVTLVYEFRWSAAVKWFRNNLRTCMGLDRNKTYFLRIVGVK
jgi:hypothetical protein